jgi:hypothetical protein
LRNVKPIMEEIVFLFGYMILSISIIYQSFLLPRSLYQPLDCSVYPRIIAGITLVIAGLQLIDILAKRGKLESIDSTKAGRSYGQQLVVLAVVACLLFFPLLTYFGYFPATFALLFMTMWLIRGKKARDFLPCLFSAAVSTLIIYFTLRVLFKAYLPEGLLFY